MMQRRMAFPSLFRITHCVAVVRPDQHVGSTCKISEEGLGRVETLLFYHSDQVVICWQTVGGGYAVMLLYYTLPFDCSGLKVNYQYWQPPELEPIMICPQAMPSPSPWCSDDICKEQKQNRNPPNG